MTTEPLKSMALTPIINASGTMTAIGASRVAPEVRAAVSAILSDFTDIDEAQSHAGATIARLTGAEAGCVTGCAAAGLTQTVAACLTGCDLARIEALPRVFGERRVILPVGHMINYGAPVDQAVRLSGAEVVPIGTAAACESWHLRDALLYGAAAAVYVVSHHTVRENEMPLDLYISECRAHGVPVLVDAASEYDLEGPIALGASAAIYSGHKFLGGPTSGIVAGTEDLVRATYLQHRGLGRTMKAGKEGIVGVIAALEAWETRDHAAIRTAEERRISRWLDKLSAIDGIALSRHPDWTGNPITRLCMTIDPATTGFHAWDLLEGLAARSPRIVLRGDLVEREEVYLDPCNLTDGEAALVASAILEEAASLSRSGISTRWSDVKAAREAAALAWSGSGNAA